MQFSGSRLLACLSLLTAFSCIDPVEPEFAIQEGLVFVEGIASTTPGATFVSIRKSAIEFTVYVVNFVAGAQVTLSNTVTGEQVIFTELLDAYVPPPDFAVAPGETWELDILLADGTHYKSQPETVLEEVGIAAIEASYDPKLLFREASGTFVPGHAVYIDYTDPAEDKNYYYWTFRTFENLDFCEKCRFSLFRDGECIAYPPNSNLKPYYDYKCETECWRIRFPESITILDDSFTNGRELQQFRVADLPLYTREDMVVQIQQFSLSPAAFSYYKVLQDILDDSKGFNAPPPAALVGNMRNVENPEDFVFGRFTAAAASVATLFIGRSAIADEPIEKYEPIVTEGFGETPPPQTTSAPCSETRFRTAIRPQDWIDQ